jgi:hypothetical protein
MDREYIQTSIEDIKKQEWQIEEIMPEEEIIQCLEELLKLREENKKLDQFNHTKTTEWFNLCVEKDKRLTELMKALNDIRMLSGGNYYQRERRKRQKLEHINFIAQEQLAKEV